MTTLPERGCGACGTGCAEALADLDDAVLHLTTGELVHVSTEHGTACSQRDQCWTAPGFASTRGQDITALLRRACRGRCPHLLVRGNRWW